MQSMNNCVHLSTFDQHDVQSRYMYVYYTSYLTLLERFNENGLRGKPSHYGDNKTHHLTYLMDHKALTFDLHNKCTSVHKQGDWYSGTSLIRTHLGQKKVSLLVRCPDFRGCNVHTVWCLGQSSVS